MENSNINRATTWTSAAIREAFLSYFESKGHRRVPSSSLVPTDDPTLLFSNAGMNQFKGIFQGVERREYIRATTAQKCLRISGKHNDLENVGRSPSHQTFFEMLGNFSFGDYFKKEAIGFAWELITEVFKLPKDRLWVTVFETDDEAEELWRSTTDVNPERIVRLGEKENFWSMGDTGPCGPCSEIHYFRGDISKEQTKEWFLADDGSFLEIWNLVFMQFNRTADGKMEPLPKPSIDTGMGFERIVSILQGVKANYDTDLFRGLIQKTEALCGLSYDGKSYEERSLVEDQQYARDVAFRVIADHVRAVSLLISDGVMPGSDGRGYVLRRLIRRAVRHGRVLGFRQPFLADVAGEFKKIMGSSYPELDQRFEIISKAITAEEIKFQETLDDGLQLLHRELERLPSSADLPGSVAFVLHDTYGFPLDLTEDALKPFGRGVDHAGFEVAMQQQKQRSRADRKSQNKTALVSNIDLPPTQFTGYQTVEESARLLGIISDQPEPYAADSAVTLVFEKTPFYAESGGQVGDTGTIEIANCELAVTDTQKLPSGVFLHHAEIVSGELTQQAVGSIATLKVDQERRNQIKRHHSATHLLQAGLKRVLGEHVQQAGSRVDDRCLRFDFNHFEGVSADQLKAVEDFINSEIRANYPAVIQEMALSQAKESGATAVFGEKYGDLVRVVQIGPNSKELCGGTHVSASGEIGFAIITGESGISSGVRRIECQAGSAASDLVTELLRERASLTRTLKSDAGSLNDRVEKLIEKNRSLEQQLEKLSAQLASHSVEALLSQVKTTKGDLKLLVAAISSASVEDLKTMTDQLRNKLGSGAIVALGSVVGDSAVLVAGATKDLGARVHLGKLVQRIVGEIGGKGGGRPDFAQAGGIAIDQLDLCLTTFLRAVDEEAL